MCTYFLHYLRKSVMCVNLMSRTPILVFISNFLMPLIPLINCENYLSLLHPHQIHFDSLMENDHLMTYEHPMTYAASLMSHVISVLHVIAKENFVSNHPLPLSH